MLFRANSKKRNWKLSDLPGGLVLPSTKLRLRHEIDSFLNQLNFKRSVVFESDLLEAVIRAIEDGVGFGFLPFHYIEYELKHKLLTALGPVQGYWKHPLHFICSKRKTQDITLVQFKNTVQEHEDELDL